MTQQCYYIGIDMDDRNAVISYYKAGMREPETLSTIPDPGGVDQKAGNRTVVYR